MNRFRNGRRTAIIYGLRTPFVRAGKLFCNLTSLDLGKKATIELINRSEIDPAIVDNVIFGTVIPTVKTPNLAREISLGSGIPSNVTSFTVSCACASSIMAVTNAVDSISVGNADVIIAGGTESVSNMPMLFTTSFRSILRDYHRAGNLINKIRHLLKLRLRDFYPDIPEIAEYSTGITLTEYGERIARENSITREEQDEFSVRSHKLSLKANLEGICTEEVIHYLIPPDFMTSVSSDNNIRKDITILELSRLKPLHDRNYGTVTSGNSAPLADGAAVLLLMSEEKANSLGYKPLAYVRSYAYAALSPKDQPLMGSVYSTPIALERAGLSLKNIDLIEMHEAFASQVLSNIKAFSSKDFAEERLGRTEPIGEIDMDKLNVNGGSIAIGHPFSSTGIRLTISLLNELSRRDENFGLVTTCAAGGLGASIILERE